MLGDWDTICATILIGILVFLLVKIVNRLFGGGDGSYNDLISSLHQNGHKWIYSQMVLDFPLHCNVCSSLLLTCTGQYCSHCGVASCQKCRKRVLAYKCKDVYLNEPSSFSHHWIKGNLPLNSICYRCNEVCGDEPGIVDYRCNWCQMTLHGGECFGQSSDSKCDFGTYRQFIIPPYDVVPDQSSFKIEHRSNNNNWTPLIVIGNGKSGNNDGELILSQFRSILNPIQIFDLADLSNKSVNKSSRRPLKIEDGLELIRLLKDYPKYLLIAGGDGTIGWVLNTIDKMKIENIPPILIYPLGTGNDLARSLGFGSGAIASSDTIKEVMEQIETFEVSSLDRWKIEVHHFRHRRLRFQLPRQELFMQNYLSIGVDALVTLNFHKARESPFYLFSSRLINKFLYFSYGTLDVLERECKDLDQLLELDMDGKRIKLPNIESLVVLNIPCWGAGVRPWELGTGHEEFPSPQINDKKLEVFCVKSSFHIAQMQVSLSEPIRLGQATEITIRLSGSAPMQIDGEPWEQHPADIHISHHKQIPIMRKK